MNAKSFEHFDSDRVPSPCFVVDEIAVERNLAILRDVCDRSGARCLLALKAFSMFSLAELVRRYLDGTCASGVHEARLGREEFGGEVHVYSAAYAPHEFEPVAELADHMVFNSLHQLGTFESGQRSSSPKLGLRINPQHSEGTNPLYDPCAPASRLGLPIAELRKLSPEDPALRNVSGLHFHTLCEQGFGPLDRTLKIIEAGIAPHLHRAEWINFGGGHHITQPDYAVDQLVARIRAFSTRYDVQVYLEPGEAVAINTGILVSTVLDLFDNERALAVLDTSATCHMPDTLEMPYRAHIFGAGAPQEKAHTYRLGGQTCLAGDVMGDYSFDQPLQRGQRLMFDDMSHYTMVKTSTFNGINLPAIAVWNSETDALRVVKQFDYADFKSRLS